MVLLRIFVELLHNTKNRTWAHARIKLLIINPSGARKETYLSFLSACLLRS